MIRSINAILSTTVYKKYVSHHCINIKIAKHICAPHTLKFNIFIRTTGMTIQHVKKSHVM